MRLLFYPVGINNKQFKPTHMKAKFIIPAAAVLILLAACKGKSSRDYEFLSRSKSTSSAADSISSSDTNKVAEKLVKTAEINFKVKNVRKAEEDIAALTTQYKGMVMHHQVQSTTGSTRDVHISDDSLMRIASFNTNGEMMVRVPSENLEEYMTRVSHMGIYVNMSKMDIDDRSLDYLSNRLKLKDREELVAQQRTGKIKIKNPADVLLLKDDMIDQKIGNLRTDAAVKYSVISLSFYQSDAIVKEVIANDDPSVYNIPLFQRLYLALVNGWSLFADLFIGLLNLWVFILFGLGFWWAIAVYRKRTNLPKAPAA